MNTQDFKRKLTAVFSADVAGYSRLMGDNEAATVQTLETYKQVMFSLIKQHRGRVIDSPGDNLLAEFASVVDAVQCGVAVQKELQARNAELPENRKMQFRIGINLGDVIEEGDRIYGDGVNIAARLEALADPGGICVSKTAFDHIESKLPLGYQFLGQQTVKNIAKPVGAYKVLMEPRVIGGEEKEDVERGPTGKPPLPLPDKPSIAVLPFVNMSDDKSQEYFSDGLTEEIITALSKTAELFVIARNSSFVYKGKAVNVQQVGRELGVKYVLEGSVRRSGDRLRITAQLIDATTGNHLWAERYDRGMKDIFAIQDEVTIKIIASVTGMTVSSVEAMRWRAEGASNLEAYLKYMEGNVLLQGLNRADNAFAGKKFEEAIALDPQWAPPYAGLALVYAYGARLSQNPESLRKANEYAQKAISLDERQLYAYMAQVAAYSFQRRYEEAIAAAELAIKVAPGSADAYMGLGASLVFACRSKEALVYLERALRMNPFPGTNYFNMIGTAHLFLRNYEEAVPALKKALSLSPKNQFARITLIVTYVEMDRLEEAKAEAEELLVIDPKWNTEGLVKNLPFKDPELTKRWAQGAEVIKKVGLERNVSTD
jgi:adenylate cyclase